MRVILYIQALQAIIWFFFHRFFETKSYIFLLVIILAENQKQNYRFYLLEKINAFFFIEV